MLFIMVMDVLNALVVKTDSLGLLQPLSATSLGHRMLLYADDVVLFSTPVARDLSLIKSIQQKFGAASGLRANMSKSSIIPIRCNELQVQQAVTVLSCQVSNFPCRYMGLPLTPGKLTSADLQPLIDKIADLRPGGRPHSWPSPGGSFWSR